MSAIIVISGPVAAGKTTVSRALIAASPTPPAYIEGDTFWSFFPAGTRPGPKRLRIIMAAMLAAAVPFASAGHDVIVDFSMPPSFLDTARQIAALRGIPLDYVVLCPLEGVCASRGAARAEGRIADYAQYHDFYAEFAAAGRHIVRDDGASAATLAERIQRDLAAGTFRI